MQKTIALLTLLVMGMLAPAVADAQPVCTATTPGAVACQSQATNLQLTDILAGTQAIGPLRANQSVKVSISQILNLPGSTQYMPFTGGTLTGKLNTRAPTTGAAGFNLSPGVAPTTPVNGDIWTTPSGMFVQAGGTTFGPLGAGGGVNSGSQNALAYYAAAGNTLTGLSTLANGVLRTSGSSVPSFSTTLPAGLTIPTAILQSAVYPNTASLPVVTTANTGQQGFVANCLNGAETGTGSGCLYVVNANGNWIAQPSSPTQQITIGGQAIYLGGGTVNQGNGSKIATFNGTGTSGDCVSINATGALVDAGGVCGGGGGGSGTVTAGTINQLAWYSASGTAVAGLASSNNAVLVTSGAGVPSLATTLPASLLIPTPTISSPILTGAGTYVGLTGTGKLVSAASTTTQAGFNVVPGVAPTAPANGDIWSTSAGFFMRYNGGTFPIGSGNGTITGITTPGPVTGGGTSGTLTLNCATCLLSASGGTLVATTPLLISGSTISMGNQPRPFVFNADQYTTVAPATYNVFLAFPYATGSITSINGITGGTGSPQFTVGVQVAGVNVATCTSITILTTQVSATCGTNTINRNDPVTLVISGVNGTPSSAVVQVTYSASAS